MIDKLEADTEYVASVRIVNQNGEGPAATTTVRTPPVPLNTKPKADIKIILSGEKVVASLGKSWLAERERIFYRSQHRIAGIAIHIEKQLLFASDSGRYIYK